LRNDEELVRFERVILPHLDAAYNLARWLTRNDHDAEDVVQEACLRAQKFFGGFHGSDGRAWMLRVVRNTCYTWLARNRPRAPAIAFNDDKHSAADPGASPLSLALRGENVQMLRQAVEQLSPEFREVIVLRELEGFSYKEIAAIAQIPPGTVMSRLARARDQLQKALAGHASEEPYHEL
jgi:RNA polymerase sigma-70 factor (ECF subfamily)